MTTSSTHQPKRKETITTVYKFKISFYEKKLLLSENLRMKSLNYFMRHIIIIVIWSCGSFLHPYFLAKPQDSVRIKI